MNPINLLIRFFLELFAIGSVGLWAWHHFNGVSKLIFTLLCPLAIAVVWAVFAVPNDPSRSGKTVIRTSGILRLLIELSVFALGFICFSQLGYQKWALVYIILVIGHYLASYKRIKWLIKQ